MEIEEFKDRLKLVQPELEVLGEYKNANTKILVKDLYGKCLCYPNSLLRGSKPTIKLALDKPLYFKNNLLNVQPTLKIIGEYIDYNTPLLIKNKYGICNCSPNELLRGVHPTILRSVDKTAYFIAQAKEIHGNKYDYSKVKYNKSSEEVIIVCNRCGRELIQKPVKHLQGHGCKECNKRKGYSRSEFERLADSCVCTLYKIRCFNDFEEFYKIGITSRSTEKRFYGKNMPYEYEIIDEIKGSAGFIYDLETKLHREHKEFKYEPKIEFSGHTECFTKLKEG